MFTSFGVRFSFATVILIGCVRRAYCFYL